MDVQAAIGNGRTLRRVMALLVALAVLAERVALRSAPVRWFVLWLLRRAAAIAEAFVLEQTCRPAPAVGELAAVGDGLADALRLAARFRTLAAALGALLPLGCRLDRRPRRRRFASGHRGGGFGSPARIGAREPNDTS